MESLSKSILVFVDSIRPSNFASIELILAYRCDSTCLTSSCIVEPPVAFLHSKCSFVFRYQFNNSVCSIA